MPVVLAKRDERKESEGEEEAKDEAEEVSEVVDPRQQSEDEQEESDGDKLEEGLVRVLEHLPAVDHLHDETGQEPELSPGRPNL